VFTALIPIVMPAMVTWPGGDGGAVGDGGALDEAGSDSGAEDTGLVLVAAIGAAVSRLECCAFK
jgi:hypothetical protein